MIELGEVEAPAPRELAPGWARVEPVVTCTNRVGSGVGGAALCRQPAAYANPEEHLISCEACCDEQGVFPETGGFDGMVSP